MVLEDRHAAVTAGLVASGVVAMPSSAAAEASERLAMAFGDLLATPFLLGLAGGFACVGVAALLVDRVVGHADGAHAGAHAAAREAHRARRGSWSEAQTPKEAEVTAVLTRGADHGAHFAADAWESTGRLRLSDLDSGASDGSYVARHLREKPLSEEPLTPAKQLAAVPLVEPPANDYESVAQSYVAAEAKQHRMLARARGVASVLMERMDLAQRSPDLEGVPQITRGVSTVDDLESWWSDAEPVTSEVLTVSARTATADEMATADLARRREAAQRIAARRTAAEQIARDVARVEQDAYPEHRTVDDLAKVDDDLWFRALKAMDERMDAQVEFSDSVGDSETIDEPDGIEPATQFINFRVPAGHSEVTDTDSYIAYLLDDELSRNSSEAVRKRSRSYLRVLEGGTQPTTKVPGRRAGKAEGARQTGRHYATPVTPQGRHFAQAAEA